MRIDIPIDLIVALQVMAAEGEELATADEKPWETGGGLTLEELQQLLGKGRLFWDCMAAAFRHNLVAVEDGEGLDNVLFTITEEGYRLLRVYRN